MASESLRSQACRILNDKVLRMARIAYAKANPNPYNPRHKHKPYTLPAEAYELTRMLGMIDGATVEEIESFVEYATTGQVRENCYA